MPLKTTTIGSFPKPLSTPVGDWFMAHKSDEEKKASKGKKFTIRNHLDLKRLRVIFG